MVRTFNNSSSGFYESLGDVRACREYQPREFWAGPKPGAQGLIQLKSTVILTFNRLIRVRDKNTTGNDSNVCGTPCRSSLK